MLEDIDVEVEFVKIIKKEVNGKVFNKITSSQGADKEGLDWYKLIFSNDKRFEYFFEERTDGRFDVFARTIKK